MKSPFLALPQYIPDAIFAVAAQAKAAGPTAIDGTIGMYLNEDGKTFLFPSVQRAVEDVQKTLGTKSYGYPPLVGLPEFRTAVTSLIFGAKPPSLASVATTGGTGAVAVNLRLARMLLKDPKIILSTPTWVNHERLCREARMEPIMVPYVVDGKASIDGIVDAVKKAGKPIAVLLHVDCHNPTGLDLARAQWEELLPVLAAHESVAILDFAYQGFADTPENDAWPVRRAIELGVTSLVCWSGSKNHSMYAERVGLAAAVTPDAASAKNAEGHMSIILRTLHSAAATFGQSIVVTTQQHYRDAWENDLKAAREMMNAKRDALLNALPAEFHAALASHGMFAMLPLKKEQVLRLRTENVFLNDDGRLNIAGIPLQRIEELGRKIAAVAAV
jgi:aspartate/tyrosine/aromatic aminotransferase